MQALLGFELNKRSVGEICAESVDKALILHEQTVFACANPHSLCVGGEDIAFRAALAESDMLVTDGVGLSAVAKVMGIDVGPRIAGFDFFSGCHHALSEQSAKIGRKGRVAFFGSSEQVLAKIKQRFEIDYPHLEICAAISPPFGDWDEASNQTMLDELAASQPDIVWVGMTAPKQEKWVQANRAKLPACVLGSIGAVFDFYAGTYERAPEWACKAGIEWLFRLVKEPRRMWRRTVVSFPVFVWLVLRYHFFNKGWPQASES